MSQPTEHKTVQARILHYAEQIGWTVLTRAEAEVLRGFGSSGSIAERARAGSRFFPDVLAERVAAFNPAYSAGSGELLRRLDLLHADIFSNRDFLRFLRNEQTYFVPAENRERNLILIDYDDPGRNKYHVTEEYYYHNGRHGNREDVVFLINGLPILVIECKNANKSEAIAIGIDQLRRYHRETPEMMTPPQLFTATEAIGFSYGVTWNTVRRNIFRWKSDEVGNLEAKIKSFCAIDHLLATLRDYILFAERDEELHKYILRQHQTAAVQRVVQRALDPDKRRGLVWHTQGSGKTFTMIKAAQLLFQAPAANKPTILLMIDRNELEDQMLKNLVALGLQNVQHADRISTLERLLRDDYRGLIVTMIHKFHGMAADVNQRANIYVLIDEAHRTTGGDLGNFLLAAIPNASFIGFSGTPIDQTAYGRGTFKTFGVDDEQGYLHKYSIADSIEDGTTLPLFYALAPNELLVPAEDLEREFLHLADAEGVTDIDELNKILERAVNTRNFLKGEQRMAKVAQYVADHYRQNVEPLGYKAFLVAVDRKACARYKLLLDTHLPPDYSAVVYTGNHNDDDLLKQFHLDEQGEKETRKRFRKHESLPKILIVTDKLLTGFDAPLLYAMYLDKPMRDHTLLQAIARVNRPYEDEARGMVKPHGFVLDFVGIFDKLEQALLFDSDEVSAVVRDIALLKTLFETKMGQARTAYLGLLQHNFDDRDVDALIDHFRDEERRKAFFKLYKELEMLYEIISPDAFMRPFIADYTTLANIYRVVREAFSLRIYVDRDFQRKTNQLVQSQVGVSDIAPVRDFYEINERGIEQIQQLNVGDNTKVINLVKSIEHAANEAGGDPFLISLAERAAEVQQRYAERQTSTQDALEALYAFVRDDEDRRRQQAEKGFDGLTFFVYRTLLDYDVPNAEQVARTIRQAFIEHADWLSHESAYRQLRQAVTFALVVEVDDVAQVAHVVEQLFTLLRKAYATN